VTRAARRLLILCGVTGPLVHVAVVVLLGGLWPGYSSTQHAISSLGSPELEIAPFMNVAGFGLAGILVSAFGAAFVAVLGLRPAPFLAACAWIAAGVTFVGLGVWPYPHPYHVPLVACSIPLAIAGMLAGAVALRAEVRSVWLACATAVATMALLTYPLSVWLPEHRDRFGAVQRLHAVGVAVWLVVAALHLWWVDRLESD
jgi:hypothetical membrane protein